MGKRLSEKKRRKIIEDYKAGMTTEQIQGKERITAASIEKVIQEYVESHSGEKLEGLEGLSYGEQKAAAMDPSYIPQRKAPSATVKNPFLGKRGHIDGVNTPPKPDEKPKTFVFGYSKEIEAINRELKQKEAADTGELKESEPIPEEHAEVPADTEATMENPDIAEEPEVERDPYDDDRRPEKWERLYYPGAIIDAILKGKNVLVANLRSRSKKMPVGVYDADDLEVWQLKELLNNEDSLFFIAKA